MAVYQALREVEGGLSVPDVVERYSGEDASGEWSDLGNEVLLSAALRWMQELRLLDVIDTGFAPPFLIADDPAPGVVKSLQAERNSKFYYYARVKGSRQWLVKNLEGVNRRANELWLSESDLSDYLGEWEPLPLDRETELLQDATEKVDVTLDLVKGDNGFAAHHPAERTKAVHDRSAFVRHVKERAAISFQFVREGVVSSLRKLASRFLDNAIGLAAEAALVAITAWLARHGFDIRKP